MKLADYLATNPRPQKANKYGNIKTKYKGETFDSKKESQYAMWLDTLKKATKKSERVVSYETQVPYKISINGEHICTYLADFRVLYADGRVEVCDVKPLNKRTGKWLTTDVYRLKKKMVKAQYGVEIIEK